jgi:glycosyltransferase involved in cell wall biosynthesis
VDGRDGLLVDPADAGSIAEAVGRLLADGAPARRLGEAGRARVLANFSIAKLLPANERFYHQLIASFPPAAS